MENNWKAENAARIGRAVHSMRKGRFTAEQLALRCGELGHPIHRTTITKIENGRGSFELADLLILAAALGIPPILLLYPDIPDGDVEVIPSHAVSSSDAMQWFYGDQTLMGDAGQAVDYSARELLDIVKERQRLSWTRSGLIVASGPMDSAGQDANRKIVEQIDIRLEQIDSRISELGGILKKG